MRRHQIGDTLTDLPAPTASDAAVRTSARGGEHHPDCNRSGDSCLICDVCAEELRAYLEAGEASRTREFDPDTSQPIDWLAAAAEYDAVLRPEFRWDQANQTLEYLKERVHGGGIGSPSVSRRAANILNANRDNAHYWDPWAGGKWVRVTPDFELWHGVRYDSAVEGRQVKCRNAACRRRWKATPEDPYYDGTTRADGICRACVLLETRTDDATPVLEAVVVTRPRKPKAAPADVEAVES
jgi:hypothetical protein